MSDFVPGTLVKMQITRRFAHYTPGDVIAVPIETARDLDTRRLAHPLAMMVPTSAESTPGAPVESTPTRQGPTQLVRK